VAVEGLGLHECQVAYEYISSQQNRNGVMILSEFAGAAQSLNGSLIINPCGWKQAAFCSKERLIEFRGHPVYRRCYPRRTHHE
jgi:trehalose-6-phosphate synthase